MLQPGKKKPKPAATRVPTKAPVAPSTNESREYLRRFGYTDVMIDSHYAQVAQTAKRSQPLTGTPYSRLTDAERAWVDRVTGRSGD